MRLCLFSPAVSRFVCWLRGGSPALPARPPAHKVLARWDPQQLAGYLALASPRPVPPPRLTLCRPDAACAGRTARVQALAPRGAVRGEGRDVSA
jgi:hypothetical protein